MGYYEKKLLQSKKENGKVVGYVGAHDVCTKREYIDCIIYLFLLYIIFYIFYNMQVNLIFKEDQILNKCTYVRFI